MKKTFFQYLKLNTPKFAIIVLVVFGVFYFLGDKIDRMMELKYLAFIIGIPLIVFFVGNYIKWRKL